MSDLLREVATLLHFDGSLAIKILADEMSDGFCLIRTTMSPGVDVAVVHDGSDCGRGEAEGYARVLSGAPAMLGLLAGVLAKWGEAVEDDEAIDGGDAVDWLTAFTEDVRAALQAMVGPLAPGQAPRGAGSASPSWSARTCSTSTLNCHGRRVPSRRGC